MGLSTKRVAGAILAGLVGIIGMSYLLVTHYLQLGNQQSSYQEVTTYKAD
ncbi:hypothetical protein [Lacticaseibacillus brantae]|nr:hypothetical protein [Lacticaseibacillus brantae]